MADWKPRQNQDMLRVGVVGSDGQGVYSPEPGMGKKGGNV